MEHNDSSSSTSQTETSHSGHPFALLVVACVVGLLLIISAFVLTPLTKQNLPTVPTSTITQQSNPTTEPTPDLARLNNQKRKSDVQALLSVIWNYAVDNKGVFPPGITSQVRRISKDEVDLCTAVQSIIKKGFSVYIEELPIDPVFINSQPVADCSQAYDTGYTVVESNGVITVSAPYAELDEIIQKSL